MVRDNARSGRKRAGTARYDIATADAPVRVLVIRTREALIVARVVRRLV